MAAKGSNEATNADVDAIRADIEKLRADLGSLLSNIGSSSREKLTDTRDRISAALGAVEGRAYGRVQGTARMMRDRGHEVVDTSREKVEHKPITYVMAAFVVGVILASLFDWKKNL